MSSTFSSLLCSWLAENGEDWARNMRLYEISLTIKASAPHPPLMSCVHLKVCRAELDRVKERR